MFKSENDGPKSKRARLAHIRYSLPYVSQVALAALCRWSVTHGGLPDITSTRQVQKARDDAVEVLTPYGNLLVVITFALVGGGSCDIEFLDPFAGLFYFVAGSCLLSVAIESALKRFPCSPSTPWRLVLYNDEVTPGNQLAHKHARKAQTRYG